jgi:hypothetical protein
MVVSVLEAIASTRFSAKVWVSTQDEAVAALRAVFPFDLLPNDTGAVRSLLRALDALPAEGDWVLFVSGDHPLLTPDMLAHFVEQGIQRQAALAVAVVERTVVQQSYPQSKRTYFHAKDGAFSGGNLFLINRRLFHPNVSFMETIDRNRKKPWKNAWMLNPVSLLQILFRRLTMAEVAVLASGLLGCSTDVIVMPFAECCMDVDKPSDKVLAEQILRKRALSPREEPVAHPA